MKCKIGLGLILTALMTSAAHADTSKSGGASSTIRITAVVPVICRVQMTPAIEAENDGVLKLGTSDEFCNAASGYNVYLKHSADMEGVTLIKGGQRIPLSLSGETMMTQSNRPDIRTDTLALDYGQQTKRLNWVSVRIVPRA